MHQDKQDLEILSNLKNVEIMNLSNRDLEIFINELYSDDEPNEKAKEAAKRYLESKE